MKLTTLLRAFTGVEWLVITIIISIIGGAIWGTIAIESDRQRLIQQCMDDGHKEYECEAMLKRPAAPTTIVIPTS